MLESETKNTGISREEAQEILTSFLKDKDLRVLAIKGKWGIGKTHLVQTALKSTQAYYASVFGVSSLEQLKAKILVGNDAESGNSNPSGRLIPNFLNWINKKSDQVSKIPKLVDYPLSGAVISVAGDLLLNSLFSQIRNAIICIDDIERKSTNFQLDELLGFIDYSVQKLKSKVILVYNEERLFQEDSSKNILEEYREKIIDLEILLEPTSEENISLVFRDDPDIEIIQQALKITRTRNIRILRKIQWILNHMRPLASKWHSNVQEQLIVNIIILALAKYDINFPVRIQEIVAYSNAVSQSSIGQGFLDEAIKISTNLNIYGYKWLEFDKQIIRLIETSSFNRKEFINQGNILSEMEEGQNIIQEFRKLWIPYFSSFRENEREISENIDRFLQAYHLRLPIQEFEKIENLASAVDLDISTYKRSLLQQLISSTEDIRTLKSIRNIVIAFPNLTHSLDEKISTCMKQLDITEILSSIVAKSGWSREEAEFLDSCTVGDYCQWLQRENNDLHILARQCLSMGIPSSKSLESAIIKLASQSKLNAMRAKFLYNIVVDADESNI